LRFLIIISNPRMLRHMLGLASAAHEKGHTVKVFFNEESVKLLTEPNRFSSLAEVVTLMEECDRTLFLG